MSSKSTSNQVEDFARKLIKEKVEDFPFLYIVERIDEEAHELALGLFRSEEFAEEVYNAIKSAKVIVKFSGR